MPPLYFDTRAPKLHNIPEAQVSEHPLPAEVLPLAQLLVASEFPFTRGEFPRRPANEWRHEDIIKTGELVVKDLARLEPSAPFTREVANRLHILGLFPDPHNYFGKRGRPKSFGEFQRELGIDFDPSITHLTCLGETTRNTQYEKLSAPELTDLLLANYNAPSRYRHRTKFKGPLTDEVITALNHRGLAPSFDYISSRFGGIGPLNEYLGFPDIRSWDEHDYILYGAKVLLYNGTGSLTLRNVGLLSKHKLGPSENAILARFDWDAFKQLANEEFERESLRTQQHKAEVEAYYQTKVSEVYDDISFAEMAKHHGLWQLIEHFTPKHVARRTIPKRLEVVTVDNVAQYLRQTFNVSAAEIENAAVMLNIFDDLWPMPKPKRLPILGDIKPANVVRNQNGEQLVQVVRPLKTKIEELTQEQALRTLLQHYFPRLEGVPRLPSNITERTIRSALSYISRRNGLTREEIEAAATKLGVIDYLISKEPLALEPIRERRKTPVVRIANLQRGVK